MASGVLSPAPSLLLYGSGLDSTKKDLALSFCAVRNHRDLCMKDQPADLGAFGNGKSPMKGDSSVHQKCSIILLVNSFEDKVLEVLNSCSAFDYKVGREIECRYMFSM